MTNAEKINSWLDECVEQSGTFFLSTVEDGKPRSRPISFHMLHNDTVYFGVGEMKDVYKQMQENPYVEITGLMGNGMQFLRYSGKAVFDSNLMDLALSQPGYPVMKKIYTKESGHIFAVFHLEEATCQRRAMMALIEEI